MFQQEQPEGFGIATGQQYSVQDFVTPVCKELQLPIEWRGEGEQEQAINPETGAIIVANA